jgi:hypothetical protein
LENYYDNPTLDSLLRVSDVVEINLAEMLKRAIQNVEGARTLPPDSTSAART